MTSYGFLLFDDVEELDVVGPWEVITASAMLRASEGANPDTTVMIAERDQPVRCAKGMVVVPHHTFADHPPLDVIVVPGGQGTRTQIDNATLLDWLASVGQTASWVTSVCTGSLLLVGSGLGAGGAWPPIGDSRTRWPSGATAPWSGTPVGCETATSSPAKVCPPASTWHCG